MKPDVQYLLEYYTGEKFLTDGENVERSSQSEDYDYSFYQNWQGYIPDGYNRPIAHAQSGEVPLVLEAQSCVDGLQGIQLAAAIAEVHVGIHGPLNAHQRQNIRAVSRNLKTIADSVTIRPSRAEQVIIQNQSLDENERDVINSIYSIRNVTTVSTIANYVGKKLTSHTMRAALRFLCDSVSNVSEELAVVCELVKLTAPTIRQLARNNSVQDVISEFVEERLPRVQ